MTSIWEKSHILVFLHNLPLELLYKLLKERVIYVIQSKKWYGLTARTPEEYFYNNCHSYDDISNVIDRKGTKILRDITPAIESFIDTSNQVAPDSFSEKLIRINDCYSKSILKDVVRHNIDNCSAIESTTDSLWTMWLDMPRIQHICTLDKVNESAQAILNHALGDLADRVVSNLSTFTTAKAESAIESFTSNVDYLQMLNWKDCRESVMKKDQMAVYVGDMIANLTEEDWPELATESVMPEIDASLESIANRMCNRDIDTEYSTENFRNIVNHMWNHFAALEAADDPKVEIVSYYVNRDMTVTPEAYAAAIMEMAIANCFPESITSALEEASKELCADWDFSIGNSLKYDDNLNEETIANYLGPAVESGFIYMDDDDYEALIATDDMLMDYDALEAAKQQKQNQMQEAVKHTGENLRHVANNVADGAEKAGQVASKVGKDVKKGAITAKTKIGKAYKFFKDHEQQIDHKVSKIVRKVSDEVVGSREEMREEIIEGKGHSLSLTLKKIITGWAVFCVSPIAFLVAAIVRMCNHGKVKRSEKKRMLMDLESEVKIVDEKIRDAEADGDREAKYQLMRTRNVLEQGAKRIRAGDEAIRGGIGTREISKMKH